ncbi:FAD/NAD(P)-binding domain-containing protein [Xylaria nigripes]|nr:FAD/NAD(P)-binding domain-containing protein [Xylaria nigripes]
MISLSPQSRPLTAGIVGAGIAGLSAAIALRRAGFEVQVFERLVFPNVVGAAISTPLNAKHVLRRWDFDFEKAGAVPNICTRYMTCRDFETIYETMYEKALGYSLHRIDLHQGLEELARTEDSGICKGIPVAIRWGCEVRGIDCENGILALSDGSKVQKDLVVIADGAHSKLLPDFLGRPAPAEPTGRSIYRWLVPMKNVMEDPELAPLYRDKRPGFIGWSDAEKRILWINYTCRGGTMLNNAVVHETKDQSVLPLSDDDSKYEQSYEDWHEPTEEEMHEGKRNKLWHVLAPQKTVLKTLENFHPATHRIVLMASKDGIREHQLFKRPPLESFVRGRTAVIGDAAHVMMPTHAAGAAMAIESAGVMEIVFGGASEYPVSSVSSDNDGQGMKDNTEQRRDRVERARAQFIKERLQVFDRLRIPRCNLTMIVSNAGPEGLRDPGVEEEIRRFYGGPLPTPDALPWSGAWRKILFDYNAFTEAEVVLREMYNQQEE